MKLRTRPLLLMSCKASGKSLHLSMPLSPHLLNGVMIVPISSACGEY